jgi:hypothetical protein
LRIGTAKARGESKKPGVPTTKALAKARAF